MPITKKQRNQLEQALYHLRRAKQYLDSPQVGIARLCTLATTTEHYTNEKHSNALLLIDKQIGSDLCGLQDAERLLSLLLAPESHISVDG